MAIHSNGDILKIEGKEIEGQDKHDIDLINGIIIISGYWDERNQWLLNFIDKEFYISTNATGLLPGKYRFNEFFIESYRDEIVEFKIKFIST